MNDRFDAESEGNEAGAAGYQARQNAKLHCAFFPNFNQPVLAMYGAPSGTSAKSALIAHICIRVDEH
ncbi:unannotated protein [freshwater metagenome]|uniref:Unannotated protein n=1 Tax=freshwater metagenome TaxID=449393 RepID=A0A6J7LMJ9_9ZZZZ